MLKKILHIFTILLKIILPFIFLISFCISAYYKFDIQEISPWYYLVLSSYLFFSIYIAFLVARLVLKIKTTWVKAIQYLASLILPITMFMEISNIPNSGPMQDIYVILLAISILIPMFLSIPLLLKLIKLFIKKIFKILKKPIILFLLFISILIIIWFYLNRDSQLLPDQVKPTPTPVAITLLQPWQLNSRYKINALVKFIKVDLDKDGQEELAAVTSYDKVDGEVFFYAGFYRYNPATEIWDEFYSEDLNIVNYRIFKKDHPSDYDEFKKKLIFIWSEEFVSLENLGDLTGDGCPEIAFSSLLQGKYFDNYIIIAQAGDSHYRYKIFTDQNTVAKIIAEDGLMIEKYSSQNVNYKDIYEWDSKNLRFVLIESQKYKITVPETPKVIPGLEEISG